MRLEPRERALAVVTLAVALFGVSSVFWFRAGGLVDQIRELRRQQALIRTEIEQDRRLAAEYDRWEAEMAKLRRHLPVYPPGQRVDVFLLSKMDEWATRYGVRILKRQAGEERTIGPLHELPIECKEWEASLEALTRFLFHLQEEADMVDTDQLYIKPREDGTLRGRFSITCAFLREDTGRSPSESGEGGSPPPVEPGTTP